MGSLCPVLRESFWNLSEERNVSVCFLVTSGGTMPCAFCGCLTVGQLVTSRFSCHSGCQHRLLSLCPAGSTRSVLLSGQKEQTPLPSCLETGLGSCLSRTICGFSLRPQLGFLL